MDTATTNGPVVAKACVPAQPTGTIVNPLPLHWLQKDAVPAAVRSAKDSGRATVVGPLPHGGRIRGQRS
ncbi:hypothetical protein AB0O91_36250 [Kitasatospora sp. NPDC089797]|uniref:hypothetical protein n=1 Tax=Kitasatospora sp. NPDC089797 TaxID=3155298 RepID=UPI003440FC17